MLKTVKKLFDEQAFGPFIPALPNIFVIQDKSATLVSADKPSGRTKCSVLITTDLLEAGRLGGQDSDEDVGKLREQVRSKGMPTTKEELVNYTVQPMASGQNYVTVLP